MNDLALQNQYSGGQRSFRQKLAPKLIYIRNHYFLYLMLVFPVAYYILFHYVPMYGIGIAFRDYSIFTGARASTWTGFLNFSKIFAIAEFSRAIRNTLVLNVLTLVFGFPAPIILALLLNEIQSNKFKRTVQTITYMPYFISLVVTCSIIKIYCQENGLFSQIIEIFGGTRRNLLIDSGAYRPIYVLSGIWQNIGWNSIIYLAALSGIDQEQYEAARIDGANRFQQMLHITIPGILPTIMILFVLRMGSILNVGYEKVLLLYTENTYNVADVFSTYTYRVGLEQKQYSLSTAVSLFNTMVNIMFLVFTNWLSRKTTESGLF